jgi:hypothetical protein
MSCCPSSTRRRFLAVTAALAAGWSFRAGAGTLLGSGGEVRINGRSAADGAEINAGDVISSGRTGRAIVVIDRDAMLLRPNSELRLEKRTATDVVVSGLRLITGGVLAVFEKGRARSIYTATATAGIRGTGVYVEAEQSGTDFCTCYGEVELFDRDSRTRRLVVATNHTPFMIWTPGQEPGQIERSEFKNHNNRELSALEQLVDRTSPLGD